MRYTTQENRFQRDTHLGLGNQRHFHKNIDTVFKRTAIAQETAAFGGSYLPYDLSSIHHVQKESPLLQNATFSSVPVMLSESRKENSKLPNCKRGMGKHQGNDTALFYILWRRTTGMGQICVYLRNEATHAWTWIVA